MPEPGDPADERAELSRRQTELVRALVVGGPIPTGFDATRVRVAAEALLRKRAGEVAWRMPQIRARLGDRFTDLFVEWARGRPRLGSAVEAEQFMAHLVERGEIAGPAEAIVGRPWWKRLLRRDGPGR